MKSIQTICAAACAVSAALAAPHPTKTSLSRRDIENTNWSGPGVQASAVSSISATISVPTIAVPDGGTDSQYFGGAWVGIDNSAASGALWQAGVNWEIDSSGATTYTVFTEWLPDPPVTVGEVTVAAGDTLTVSLTLDSPTSGSVDLSSSNGGATTVAGTAPSSSDTVDGGLALWILEDVLSSAGPAPFANYGSLSFTGCAFDAASGGGDPSTGDIYHFGGSGCTVAGSEVDCTYEG